MVNQRLLWSNPKTESQMPYDIALSGFDAGRPLLLKTSNTHSW